MCCLPNCIWLVSLSAVQPGLTTKASEVANSFICLNSTRGFLREDWFESSHPDTLRAHLRYEHVDINILLFVVHIPALCSKSNKLYVTQVPGLRVYGGQRDCRPDVSRLARTCERKVGIMYVCRIDASLISTFWLPDPPQAVSVVCPCYRPKYINQEDYLTRMRERGY